MIVNDELARTWNEEIMTCFKVRTQHFSTGTEKYNEQTLAWTASLQAKNLTPDLPNTNVYYHAVSKLGPKCFIYMTIPCNKVIFEKTHFTECR
jgi:hypothetical protein